MKKFFRRIRAGLAGLVFRKRLEEDLDAELREYVSAAAERKMAAGISREEAMRIARVEMGSMAAVKESVRDAGWESVLESLWRDARYAFRVLRRSPGFALVTMGTLALGIGANTAVFSVAHAVMLRPLPYLEPERLLAVIPSQKGGPAAAEPISYPTFRDWQRQSRSFEAMAAYVVATTTLTGRGEAEAPVTAGVTPNLFSMLGATPLLGRALASDDAASASGRVAVVTEQFWRERLHSARDAVGQSLTLDGAGHTIVGVLPSSFRFPHTAPTPQIWIPLTQFSSFEPLLEVRMAPFLSAFGRLRREATVGQAQAEMETIVARLRADHPTTLPEQVVRVRSLQEHVLGDTGPSLVLLLAAVCLLLLIACTNVASLQMARAIGRAPELTMRLALGAGKWRIARQLLVESLMLALAGGAVGVLVAFASLRLLSVSIAAELPQIHDIGLDTRVLAFALSLSCLAGLLFGLLPLLGRAVVPGADRISSAGRGATAERRQLGLQNVLVVVQVAFALVMLTTAGLLVRSLVHLNRTNPGFVADSVVTATISLPQSEYKTPERWLQFNENLLERVRHLPGVEAAALGVAVPFLGPPVAVPFEIDGKPTGGPQAMPMSEVMFTSEGYFSTLQIPLIRGREFLATDRRNTLRVAVVNRSFAHRYFGTSDPIGQRIHVGAPKGVWVEVVGLAGDTAQVSLVTPAPALIYMPYSQRPFWITSLVVRTSSEPQLMAAALRREVASIAPNVPVMGGESLGALLQRSYASSSHRTRLLVLFAGLAAALTAIGIHGLVAYTAARRTKEFGIRLALGAGPGRLQRSVLRQGLRLTSIGIAIGLAIAIVVTRFLATLLHRVSSTDPVTFAGVVLLLVLVALAACYTPARRVTRVDPLIALRSE